MKRIATLAVLLLTLAVVPAMAQTIYDNGPVNGNTDAWTINFGFVVSDTFNVANDGTTITGFSMYDWLFPGDTLTSAEINISTGENGGTSLFDQVVNFTQSACSSNGFGYNVCLESSTFSGPTLNAGTYWINLENASVPSGDPVYWDENSGPSSASENSVGSIPSEAFTVNGTQNTGTVPEPSSILLLGSGIVGLAGVMRRRLF